MPKLTPRLTAHAEQAKTLLTVLAEAAARQKAAKKAGIRSGCLVLLAGIVFRRHAGHNTRPKHLHETGCMGEKLARAYIRELIGAGLVRLQVVRGCRWLSPTLDGFAVATDYARHIRSGSRDFSQH